MDVPDKARPRRIARGAARDGDALKQVADLFFFDVGLDGRVTDVGVRMRQNINGEFAHRLERDGARGDFSAGGFDGDQLHPVKIDIAHGKPRREPKPAEAQEP